MDKQAKKKYKGLVITLIIVFSLGVIYFGGGLLGPTIAFNLIFSRRLSSPETLNEDIYQVYKTRCDYPALNSREEYAFEGRHDRLVCYYYETDANKPTVLCAHGMSSLSDGREAALENYFVSKGLNVLALDLSSSGNSGGTNHEGFHRGMEDVIDCVSFFRTHKNNPNLPLILMGYSWGGYAVASSLSYLDDILGCITFSAFNKADEMMFETAKSKVGFLADLTKPMFYLSAQMYYGEKLNDNGVKGLSSKPSMESLHFHGTEDQRVLPKASLVEALKEHSEIPAKTVYLDQYTHELPWFSQNSIAEGYRILESLDGKTEEQKKASLSQVDKNKTSEMNPEVMDELDQYLSSLLDE